MQILQKSQKPFKVKMQRDDFGNYFCKEGFKISQSLINGGWYILNQEGKRLYSKDDHPDAHPDLRVYDLVFPYYKSAKEYLSMIIEKSLYVGDGLVKIPQYS